MEWEFLIGAVLLPCIKESFFAKATHTFINMSHEEKSSHKKLLFVSLSASKLKFVGTI